MNLEQVISLIKQGKTLSNIDTEYGTFNGQARRLINLLKDETSEFYDIEKYEKIEQLIEQNRQIKIKENSSNYDKIQNYSKQFCLNEIINKKMNINQAAEILHLSPITILEYLNEAYNKNHNEELKNILEEYKYNFLDYENKNLSKKNNKFQYEIIMLALTFRVSIQNLCHLFKTNTEDIEDLFKNFSEFSKPLNILNLETCKETEELSKIAFQNACNYMKRRNEILKLLNKARTNNESDKVSVLEEKLKTLRSEIDDTNVLKLKEKRLLSEEEKESIVKYRLKYGLSKIDCSEVFNMRNVSITAIEDNLIENNLFYKVKLSFLNDYYDRVRSDGFANKR